MPKPDRTVTLSEAELDALIADRVKRSQRSPQEQQLRDLIGEVIDDRLGAMFEPLDNDDDDDADKPRRNGPRRDDDNDDPPKDEPGLMDTLLGWIGGKDDEPAKADA